MVEQPHFAFVFAHRLVLLDVFLDGALCDDVLFAVIVKLVEQMLVAPTLTTVGLAQALDQVAATGVFLFDQIQHLGALA